MTENNPRSVFENLAKACEGLIYISETDSPFTIKDLGPKNEATPRELHTAFDSECDSPVQQISLQDFFQRLTTEQDWHDDQKKRQVAGFRAMKKSIEDNLSEVKVLRIGSIRIHIFIVGRTSEGNTLVIHTKSVET